MTHDPLCPMWSKVWAGDVCDCDLIAKVRKDERERAGIEQTVPSHEYPFTTVVTVEAAMTDMQRWEVALLNASGSGYRTRQSETGEWVRFADAEAAIAAAREDMLAKCIAALPHDTHCLDTWYDDKASECFCESAACDRALRALEEKP